MQHWFADWVASEKIHALKCEQEEGDPDCWFLWAIFLKSKKILTCHWSLGKYNKIEHGEIKGWIKMFK